MSFRLFALGLTASFGLAWLAVVVVPFFKLQHPSPVSFQEGLDEQTGIYHPKRAGRVVNGYEVYAENGCYQCHTQVIRPTYAGNDLGRPDWAGMSGDPDRGDTRRESNVFDYSGLDYAPIGVTRIGPDLMNIGRRITASHGGDAESWFYLHLYNPRLNPALDWSACPPMPFLFEEREIRGQRSLDALEVETEPGIEIVPGPKARALVSYLMSLQNDNPVPGSMNYAPKAPKGANNEG